VDIPSNYLTRIFGKSSGTEMSNTGFSQVSWHQKQPSFLDEIKIKLPTVLTKKHHLLFKFYHIICQKPKKGEDELEVNNIYEKSLNLFRCLLGLLFYLCITTKSNFD
jgi:hypothetical protein